MKYQSELIKEIIDSGGHEKSSLHYESECVESWIEEAKGGYPKLCDYQSEWLNYINENSGIGNFPYLALLDVTDAVVDHVVPYAYKSVILKGSTKYRDIDTGEVLDAFEDGRNLELVSVKMPVLTTTGKNLMSSSLRYDVFLAENGIENTRYQDIVSKEFIQVEASTSYGIATFYQGEMMNPQNIFICEYDNNKKFIKRFNVASYGVFATHFTTKYIKFSIGGSGIPGVIEERKKIFIELEKTRIKPTAYEPYKTNILTVNEDVTLRGIGDVKDTLNCLTGEVTERIGEIVLDGVSIIPTVNRMANQNNTIAFDFKESFSSLDPSSIHSLNDTFPDYSGNDLYANDVEGLSRGWNAISVRINKDRLAQADAKGFKQWLQSNPITVQYQLTTESVKTVDLTIIDQDGNPLSTIKPIEGTMVISTDGTPIKPLLSAEIPVEATTQNLFSFIGLEME